MIRVDPKYIPLAEPEFVPASLWTREFRRLAVRDPGARPLTFALMRPDGSVTRYATTVLSAAHPAAALNERYAERVLKTLLWARGGSRVLVAGAPELARRLGGIYGADGARAFDRTFLGERVYRAGALAIVAAGESELPAELEAGIGGGGGTQGCRIGFDLGGSTRKAAAVVDGRVVFSEEVAWDPCHQSDPEYHFDRIHNSITRAAAWLPRVDGIGGSAAGVYVDNEVRVASLFRGIAPERFERDVRPMFARLRERWGGVPLVVANDGDVAALAGAMAAGKRSVLGLSLGTSLAGGFVTAGGELTSWLNELAFVPVDFRPDAPVDEWSGDRGCGERYLSRPGIVRLARRAGCKFPPELPESDCLRLLQRTAEEGDVRAKAVFESAGTILGYSIAYYADFYPLRSVVVMGGAVAGVAAELMLERARDVLRGEFPALAETIELSTLDGRGRRHGQAIAAASLPRLEAEALRP